jgi:hypothetical protein
MDLPTTQPEPQEHGKPRRHVRAIWMVLGAIVLLLVGLAAWIVVDVLPESRWAQERKDGVALPVPGKPGQYRFMAAKALPIGPSWLTDRLPSWYHRHMSRVDMAVIQGEGWSGQELETLAGFGELRYLLVSGSNAKNLPLLPQVEIVHLVDGSAEGVDRFPNVQWLIINKTLDGSDAAAISRLRRLKKLEIDDDTDRRVVDDLRAAVPGLTVIEEPSPVVGAR